MISCLIVHGLKPGDIKSKKVQASRRRKGRREYLNDSKTKEMMRGLNNYCDIKVEIPLIRYEKRQRIETLINEETLILAIYIRGETHDWAPNTI